MTKLTERLPLSVVRVRKFPKSSFMVNGIFDYYNYLRAKIIYSAFNPTKRSPRKLIKGRKQYTRVVPKLSSWWKDYGLDETTEYGELIRRRYEFFTTSDDDNDGNEFMKMVKVRELNKWYETSSKIAIALVTADPKDIEAKQNLKNLRIEYDTKMLEIDQWYECQINKKRSIESTSTLSNKN